MQWDIYLGCSLCTCIGPLFTPMTRTILISCGSHLNIDLQKDSGYCCMPITLYFQVHESWTEKGNKVNLSLWLWRSLMRKHNTYYKSWTQDAWHIGTAACNQCVTFWSPDKDRCNGIKACIHVHVRWLTTCKPSCNEADGFHFFKTQISVVFEEQTEGEINVNYSANLYACKSYSGVGGGGGGEGGNY